MTLREIIKNQILDSTNELNVELSNEELRIAIAGVEHCVSECMADSVSDAISGVLYDRKLDSNFPQDMPDSFKNFIKERSK
jgi:hypothetical protein